MKRSCDQITPDANDEKLPEKLCKKQKTEPETDQPKDRHNFLGFALGETAKQTTEKSTSPILKVSSNSAFGFFNSLTKNKNVIDVKKYSTKFNSQNVLFFDLDCTVIYNNPEKNFPPYARSLKEFLIPNQPDFYLAISILFFDIMKPILNWVAHYFQFGVITAARYPKELVSDIFTYAFGNKEIKDNFIFINANHFESESFDELCGSYALDAIAPEKAIALDDWRKKNNFDQRPIILIDDQVLNLAPLPKIIEEKYCEGIESCVYPFKGSSSKQDFLANYGNEKDRTEDTDYTLGSYLINIAMRCGLHQLACIFSILPERNTTTKEKMNKIPQEKITLIKEYMGSSIFKKWCGKHTLAEYAAFYERNDFLPIMEMLAASKKETIQLTENSTITKSISL